MRLTSVKTVLAVIAGGAAALALSALYRGAGRDAASVPDDAHAAHEAALSDRSESVDDAASTSPASSTHAGALVEPSRSERDLAWQTELRDATESFRNSALLIAIRENGLECADVTSAEQGSEPLGGWRVTCRGALTYLVAVAAGGQLVVEPMPIGDNFLVRPPESLPEGELPLSPPNR